MIENDWLGLRAMHKTVSLKEVRASLYGGAQHEARGTMSGRDLLLKGYLITDWKTSSGECIFVTMKLAAILSKIQPLCREKDFKDKSWDWRTFYSLSSTGAIRGHSADFIIIDDGFNA